MKNSIIFVLFCLSLLIFGCGDGGKSEKTADNDSGRETGSLYGECYPNETCDKGLECDVENNICIRKPDESNHGNNDFDNESIDAMSDEDNDKSDTLSEQNDDNVDAEDDSDSSMIPDDGGFTDDSDSVAQTPCKPNPCVNVENSTGTCTPIDETKYSCWCKANYTWDSSTKTCRDDYFEENDDDDVVSDIDNDYDGCTVGKYKCSNSQSMYCNDSGYWTNNEYCAYGCDSSTGKCKSSECTTGEYKCSAVGSYYSYSLYCNDGLWKTDQLCEGDCDSSTGKCKDVCYNVDNKMFSYKVLDKNWSEAKDYCDKLTACGYSDWHLPTISELRILIQNCAVTETNGACGITETCRLWNSNCNNDACEGCDNDSSGKYSKLGDNFPLWSSTSSSSDSDRAFYIYFSNASISHYNKSSMEDIRCVRNAD